MKKATSIALFAALTLLIVLPAFIVKARAAGPSVPVQFDERADWKAVCAAANALPLKSGGCVLVSKTPVGCVVITAPKPGAAIQAAALEVCAKATAAG